MGRARVDRKLYLHMLSETQSSVYFYSEMRPGRESEGNPCTLGCSSVPPHSTVRSKITSGQCLEITRGFLNVSKATPDYDLKLLNQDEDHTPVFWRCCLCLHSPKPLTTLMLMLYQRQDTVPGPWNALRILTLPLWALQLNRHQSETHQTHPLDEVSQARKISVAQIKSIVSAHSCPKAAVSWDAAALGMTHLPGILKSSLLSQCHEMRGKPRGTE